jgi:hypothetical protein
LVDLQPQQHSSTLRPLEIWACALDGDARALYRSSAECT